MEVNDQTLGVLRDLLLNVLNQDNAVRRTAENYIKSQETQRGFPVLVLTLIQRLISGTVTPQDAMVRQSAAVLFKNVVKNHWMNEDNQCIALEDKEIIKAHLVELMTTAPMDVQKQLSEAVALISKHDFPEHWHNLLPQLVAKLSTDDIQVKKGIMLTANSLMKRFRYVFKSDELYAVLVICLQAFSEPLLQQFTANHHLIMHAGANKSALEALLETQRLGARIFFSLCWQDLPEYFEDHVNEWMAEFAKYLSYSSPLLADGDEPGPVELLQTAIIENLSLFATRYEEVFEPFLPQFTQAIWGLLLSMPAASKYDLLAVGGIKFLTSVASKQMNVALFTDAVLRDIIEHIVIKNLYLTENDLELFEDNVYDYVRKDFEGSDTDSRRRSAMELTRALMKFFAAQVTSLCTGYINTLLSSYHANRANYKDKDAALHLMLSVALKSSSTGINGLEVNPAINIVSLLEQHVLPELSGQGQGHEVIKADCVKVLCIFRSHLPAPLLASLVPGLVSLLAYPNMVVKTYSAMTIEKVLLVRDKDSITGLSSARLTRTELLPSLEPLLTHLMALLSTNEAEHANNEYVMKALMRVLLTIAPDLPQVLPFLLPQLVNLLARVCKNPVNPHYNHYLFEVLVIIVDRTAAAPALAQQLEAALFPPFQVILGSDLSEFIPYVFQIFASLLFASTGPLSEGYRALFTPLLSPVLWEKKGQVPALTDLLRAYLSRAIGDVLPQLQGVLGVFQKLLASKSSEQHAFSLLNAIFTAVPPPALAPYVNTLFQLLLQRMMESAKEGKTTRYARLFLHSMSVFAAVHGAALLYSTIEGLTVGLMGMIIRNIWTPNKLALAAAYGGGVDNKALLVGGAKLLTDTPLAQDLELWGLALKAVLAVLPSSAAGPGKVEDEDDEPVLHDPSSGVDGVYSKLVHARLPGLTDPVPEVASGGLFFAQSLSTFLKTHGGPYLSYIQSQLDDKEMAGLQALCQAHGVALS